MATLEKIRNKGATILLIFIGLALFGFVFEGLLDSGANFFNRARNNVITVDGRAVSIAEYSEYNETFTNINQVYNRARTGEVLTTQQTEQIRIQASFENLLRKILITNAAEKVGITVPAGELRELMSGTNMSPIIRSSPLFVNPMTGELDRNELARFARSDHEQERNIWLFLEDEVRVNRLTEKYAILLANTLNANSLEAKHAFANSLATVDLNYIMMPFNTIDASTISISDRELQAAYTQRREQFRQERSRDIQYILFPIRPSQSDFEEMETWINNLMYDFRTYEDVSELVTFESEIPFPAFFLSEANIDPNFREFAFSGEINETLGPIFVDDSYSAARIIDRKMAPDSINIRLISVFDGTTERTAELADSIIAELRAGSDFGELAVMFSQDPHAAFNRGEYGWLTQTMLGRELAEPVFNHNIGDIFSVTSNFGHVFIIEILDKTPDVEKVKLAILTRRVEPSRATFGRLYNEVQSFLITNTTLEQFEASAREQGLIVLSTNVQESTVLVGNLPDTRPIVQWALSTRRPGISPTIFESYRQYVVAAVTAVNNEEFRPLSEVRDFLEAYLIRERQGEMIAAQMQENLRAATSIEDLASRLSLPVERLNNINFANSGTAIGFEPAIVATAPFLQENELSQPIKGEMGVFVVSPFNIRQSELEFNSQMEREQINNLFIQSVFRNLPSILRSNANIIDNRSSFF